MCLGIPAQLVAVVEPGVATAEVSGVRRDVSTAFVPEARVGDWVLVHVGFALHTIDEDEARRTLELLEQIEW
jgi:hydrogenase expression/formation protein HypC